MDVVTADKEFMYSFPAEGEGIHWKQGMARRIWAADLALAWRNAAGGCRGCSDDYDDGCVGKCLKDNLSLQQLEDTWNQVAGDMTKYPNYGVPGSGGIIYQADSSMCVGAPHVYRCMGAAGRHFPWPCMHIALLVAHVCYAVLDFTHKPLACLHES